MEVIIKNGNSYTAFILVHADHFSSVLASHEFSTGYYIFAVSDSDLHFSRGIVIAFPKLIFTF